jgi:plasmid stabilization system protein ParE
MPQASWTPRATLHLEDIAYYIAVESQRPATAEKIAQEIRDKADRCAQNPLMSEARPDLGAGYRIFRHKR